MQRWPSQQLLQAERDRIRSSVELTALIEELTRPAPGAAREQPSEEATAAVRRLTRLG